MKQNEFKCEYCGGVFEHLSQDEWSEKDKQDELEALFGDIPLSECASVCDDCFNTIFPEQTVEKKHE